MLSRLSLRTAYLIGQPLSDADLEGSSLAEAILIGCAFVRSDLSNTDLKRANLTCALLVHTDLTNADLRGARLESTEVFDVETKSAKFDAAGRRVISRKKRVKRPKMVPNKRSKSLPITSLRSHRELSRQSARLRLLVRRNGANWSEGAGAGSASPYDSVEQHLFRRCRLVREDAQRRANHAD